MLPAECGDNLPPILVSDTEEVNGSDESVLHLRALGLQSVISVERLQLASPPVSGTFYITYQGKVSEGELFYSKSEWL